MPTAAEASANQSQLESTLDAGLDQLSQQEQIEFQQYQKFVLSQDGSVFWSATGQKMTIGGSLHYATDRAQDEDQTIGANNVMLSSKSEITAFNTIQPQYMWIGSWPIGDALPPLMVAFAQRGPYYREADVWHYAGFAVFPALKSQIINSAADLPPGPIVSNSLPIWLSLNSFAPVYPSFLVPDNIVPPYIVAHIEPGATEALGAFPIIGPWPGVTEPDSGASPLHDLASSQLTRDEVTLTLYGFSNQRALQYLQSLIQASIDPGLFGFANSPVVQDEKRLQVEITALAQKKKIRILANYYQSAADVEARRLILSASVAGVSIIGGVPVLLQGNGFQAEQIGDAEGFIDE